MGTTVSSLDVDAVSVDHIKTIVDAQLSTVAENGMVSKKQLQQLLKGTKTNNAMHRKTSFTNRDIKDILAMHGLLPDDPRVRELFEAFEASEGLVTLEDFEHIRQSSVLINRALSGGLVVPDFEELRDDIRELYEKVKPIRSGANADYIPQLSEKHVDPELFGISICTIDGQRFNVGDTDTRFGIQSCSKALSYCIAQQLHGPEIVHQHVGMEPSGRPFNEMCLDHRAHNVDMERQKTMSAEEKARFKPRPAVPHNPMINAGAIMTCSLLFRDLAVADRFDAIMEVWSDLCGCDERSSAGQRPSFANSMYLSEASTADRNFCLGYMMQEEGAFMPGTNLVEILNLYFMCCSIELSATMMATVAATLANGGVNPLTGKRVFTQPVVKNTLSLMASCGMYDFSGQFAFTMGFPAKSGVGGGILIVIPGVMGICTFSPRLDSIGNSVRGVAFCHALSEKFSFHNFDTLGSGVQTKKNPARSARAWATQARVRSLLWAATSNNILRMRHLLISGCNVNGADYDGRTALHLAASNGHEEAVKFLVSNGANTDLKDRFGNKPLDDAKREGHEKIATLLTFKRGGISLKDKNPGLVALGSSDGRTIETERVLRALEEVGIPRSDQRVSDALKEFPKMLNSAGFNKVFAGSELIRKGLTGELILRDFSTIKEKFKAIFDKAAENTSGLPSQAVPQLARQDPKSWAVSVCSVDGQRLQLGDVNTTFTVQSCFKAINYCIALEENGYEKVNRHVGREPSGRHSDEMVLDRRTTPAIPHNPFVNAGAIMSCALIKPSLKSSEARIDYCLRNYWSRLTGRPNNKHTYDEQVYSAELLGGDRNRCLTYMMAESKSYPPEVNTGQDLLDNLMFYFKCCSVQLDADRLSVVAATLASGGVCPVTGERVFERETVRDCLSLMYSCGMYDYSGEFAFKIGFPSKSGAAGAMMIVIPDRMGICTFSPNLDHNGISVRGLDFCEQLSKSFNFHLYDRLPSSDDDRSHKIDPTNHGGEDHENNLGTLIESAFRGDIRAFTLQYNLSGINLVNSGDYDGRTALHLAATEGHMPIVEFIVIHANEGLDLEPRDRWGITPLDDARKAGHSVIVGLLETALKSRTSSQLLVRPMTSVEKVAASGPASPMSPRKTTNN